MPTCCPAAGSGDGAAHSHSHSHSHSHEQHTYHLPVLLRESVAVLGVPSKGRW